MVQAGRNFALLTALAVGLSVPLQAQDTSTAPQSATVAPTASASAPVSSLPGEAIALKTSDGWNLSAQYHPAKPGELTLILVHGTGANKEIWAEVARVLARSGYGVLAFDLRGHGESSVGPDGKPVSWKQFSDDRENNDFLDMSRDVDAAADYLATLKIAPSSTAFVGEGLGGTLALRYAVTHPQIAMTALISPGLGYQNVPLLSALRDYGSRPLLIIYSQSDREVANAAPLIYAVAKISAGEQNVTMIPSHLRSDFLFGKTISDRLTLWLDNPVNPEAAVAPSSSTATSPLNVSSPPVTPSGLALPTPSL